MFTGSEIREQFPALHQDVYGKPLVYLDNAATTQKPKHLVEALNHYYHNLNSNIHRANHYLGNQATEAFENSRSKTAAFIQAAHEQEIIFTKGTTESINLVAQSLRHELQAGDQVMVTAQEHHANLVPWQQICQASKAKLIIVPMQFDGHIDVKAFRNLLSERVKIVAMPHISNVLGMVNPVKEMTQLAHEFGAKVLIDGAQGIVHTAVNVQDLNCDFYTFSTHKVYGPMGVGVLFGRKQILENMPVFLTGGEMVERVSYQEASFNALPYKFEAGTPNVADVVAWGSVLDFLNGLNMTEVWKYEDALVDEALHKLNAIDGFHLLGSEQGRKGLISFNISGIHASDLGILLDKMGVAIRTGYLCAEPLMHEMNQNGAARISFAMYNTPEEINTMMLAIKTAISMLR